MFKWLRLLNGNFNIVRMETLHHVIIKGCSTFVVLLTAITPIDFLLFNLLDFQILIHKVGTVLPSFVNFQISTC